ncbi:hypothetical protein [Streptomyces sp. AC495_CC817]|uniref:hypothetical protein n=1 Tax=Streptomyces sp. AC495_CC817 TaxID=2823900 RepID=UPI001C276D32|nr:hypothetical protein [Streptomyces sp. AC495_CC817]
MRAALRTFGSILARHWPALMAWYLGGEALHQLFVQAAGFVGGRTTLGGLLILPLAVAARLVSYVAMYLTVRPSLAHGAPGDGGYRGFVGSVLVAILPFFAFYAAWGMLDADQTAFFRIASGIAFADTGFGLGEEIGDRGGLISVGLLPVTVLVVALLARMLLAKFRDRLPSWTLALAAYAEVLWTFMLFTLVGQWLTRVREWYDGRAGAAWFDAVGDWVAATVPPLASIWEGVLWLVGVLVAAVIVPAAWLAVAGVVYGAGFTTLPPVLRRRTESLRGAVGSLSRALLQRLEDLWAAVAAIWRGGPLLFGLYAVVYAVWALAERLATRELLHLFGPHEARFWATFLPLMLVGVAAIAEPLRVAIVATAFDAVVGRPGAGIEVRDSAVDAEAHDLGAPDHGHVEPEGAGRVVGDEEHREDAVGG